MCVKYYFVVFFFFFATQKEIFSTTIEKTIPTQAGREKEFCCLLIMIGQAWNVIHILTILTKRKWKHGGLKKIYLGNKALQIVKVRGIDNFLKLLKCLEKTYVHM